MHSALRLFIRQFLCVALAAAIPVAVTAFLSIPFNLGGHPGELRPLASMLDRHMT